MATSMVMVARTPAGTLTAAVGLLLALGPGHNIPFLGGTPGVIKELVLIGSVVLIGSIVLVELQTWLARRAHTI